MDATRKANRDGVALDPSNRRTKRVQVWLSPLELEALDNQREGTELTRAEFLRCASIGKLPPSIPKLNREQYVELSRLSANLNQIARHMNGAGSTLELIGQARGLLIELKSALIRGVDHEGESRQG